MEVSACALKRERGEAPCLLPERGWRIEGVGEAGEIIFLKDDNPAGTHRKKQLAQDRLWFWQVHQDKPADQSVELLVQYQGPQVGGLEGDMLKSSGLRAGSGDLEHVRAGVDAEHAARGADQLGGEQSDLAWPAANIEHRHSGGDPSLNEHTTGERLV